MWRDYHGAQRYTIAPLTPRRTLLQVHYLEMKEAKSGQALNSPQHTNADLCVAAAQGDVMQLRHLVRKIGLDVDGVSCDGCIPTPQLQQPLK